MGINANTVSNEPVKLDEEIRSFLVTIGAKEDHEDFYSLTATRSQLQQLIQWYVWLLGLEHHNLLVTIAESIRLLGDGPVPDIIPDYVSFDLLSKLGAIEKHLELGGSELIWY